MVGDRHRLRSTVARAATLRVRITLVSVLVVALALAAGAILLLGLLRANLLDYSKTAAAQRADTVASKLSAGNGAQLPSLAKVDDDEFVQIVASDGSVLASTKNARGLHALHTSDDAGQVRPVPFDDDHDFVLVHKDVKTPDGTFTVITGHDLEARDDATGSVSTLLLAGCPIMLLIVGAIAWFAVGGALGPVDRIRRAAEDIMPPYLGRRLPEPARQDEIGRLARTMNVMLARLDHSQHQQRRFISDAAHELRSPVAAIKQSVEVAATYPDALSTAELIDAVRSESARLECLTLGLLGLARLDERTPELSANPVDLDDLAFGEVQRLRSTTALRIDATAVSAGRVGGEEALLGQVLRNLVDNAARHATSTITLSLAEHEHTVTLSVEDDGPGIPPEERERVFERFVRLDEARSHGGGAGLGLAIVHDIVTAYDGNITVTDSRLGGVCFLITLPRLDDTA